LFLTSRILGGILPEVTFLALTCTPVRPNKVNSYYFGFFDRIKLKQQIEHFSPMSL